MNGLISLTKIQEEHSHTEAERSIEENEAKAEREAKKVQEHEKALAKEEKALEEIQESLKGNHTILPCPPVTESTSGRQNPFIPRPDRGQAEGAAALDHQA